MTIGFFQDQMDPRYRIWTSDVNAAYVQYEINRRLHEKYTERSFISFQGAKDRLLETMYEWKGPLTMDELLEKTICDCVNDIDTEIQYYHRFDGFDKSRLYFPGTGLTREEKVKLNPGYKFEFQMKY